MCILSSAFVLALSRLNRQSLSVKVTHTCPNLSNSLKHMPILLCMQLMASISCLPFNLTQEDSASHTIFFSFHFELVEIYQDKKKTIVCQLTYELIIWSCVLVKSMYKTKQDVMKYSSKFCTEQTSIFFLKSTKTRFSLSKITARPGVRYPF